MTSAASLIFLFLDLLLIETAHSSSDLIMYKDVAFFTNLLAQIVSSPVVMIVMVAKLKTSSVLSCNVNIDSAVRFWS